jgi:hypothetical protein
MLLISSSEDPDDSVCVLAPALALPHSLPGAAMAFLLATSLPSRFKNKGGAHQSPTPPLPPRSPGDCPTCRLSSTFSSMVEPAPLPVRPWREIKSRRGAPQRMNTQGFACPNHKCPYFGITDAHVHAPLWRWHSWPGFAHPDLSRPCLSHDVHCSARHPLVPSENSLPSGRNSADCARLVGWILLPQSVSSATDKPPSPPGCRARARTLRPCTNAPSATSSSRTSNWTNCAPGYAALHRCCGCG